MKLDRNINKSGKGKYALVLMRELPRQERSRPDLARLIADNPKCLDVSKVGDVGEFFVIRLRDIHAEAALNAYADSAAEHDKEWANEVRKMAKRAGRKHPRWKFPD